MAEVIEINKVNFTVQDREIVKDISVVFKTSKTTAIVGPSGSGKSTVLKLAAGLLVPNEGEVLYNGLNIAQMNRVENLEFRRRGAFVFQDSALWANQNLYQILELPLKIHYPDMNKRKRDDRIKEVAALVGYRKDLNIRPARLSMGEQKLIAFARAMLCEPNLIYLDEWAESLDEASAERLFNIIRRKQKEGCSFLFVCHDIRLIRDLADFIVVVIDGKISIQGPKEIIINDLCLKDFLRIELAS